MKETLNSSVQSHSIEGWLFLPGSVYNNYSLYLTNFVKIKENETGRQIWSNFLNLSLISSISSMI